MDFELRRKLNKKQYINISLSAGCHVIAGSSNCLLGHKLNSENGSDCEGVFVEWNWDGEKLTVKNDRYGIYPLFYAELDDGICVSESIYHILNTNVNKKLDYEALSVFLRIGHVVSNDTPFENIKVLPPNSILTWSQGCLQIESNKVEGVFSNHISLSYSKALDGYIELFRCAISKREPKFDDFHTSITGGRDSRHILFELYRQNMIPKTCVTLKYRPPSTNEDVRIAKIISDRLGLNHEIIDKPSCWYSAILMDIYLTNFCGNGHSWILPLASFHNSKNTKVAFDGLAGGIISSAQTVDNNKADLFKSGRLEDLAVLLLDEAGFGPFIEKGLSNKFSSFIRKDVAVNRLVKELKRHVDTSNPVLSYTFWNRTRRAVSSIPFSILSNIKYVYCPYLDHSFFDFCTSLESSYVLSGDFHDEVIKKAFPEYSNIPYEDKRKVAVMDRQGRSYYQRSISKFIFYMMSRVSSGSEFLDLKYIMSRALRDKFLPTNAQPWYLRPAVFLLELENQCNR